MALKDYYESLSPNSPRKEIRDRILKECGITEMTLYRWISGDVIPEKLKQEKVAEITGVPVDDLFTKKNADETRDI